MYTSISAPVSTTVTTAMAATVSPAATDTSDVFDCVGVIVTGSEYVPVPPVDTART